ncbi:polysaccharide deacetylase family protein [Gillisia hiemivivida]|uniref:Polysaccharide deacetylase family protein n=1 Tax=Gillisia hiemivivida TaxID=291190 RepID=A0A5C6ZZC6_9FLAO|nr:polysaccharide deacetylase family protein [Gillisia hiemivivida]TXD94179.1 polysaccharide deacetylase family protein [Gillisia hiemivivida]
MSYKPFNIVVILLFFIGVLLVFFEFISIWILLIAVLAYLFFLLLISSNVQWNFFVKAYNNNPAITNREIALTFDDGPVENTLEILALLKKYNAKASFFCIGKQIQENPEIFQKILQEGHLVGNHTFSHTRKMGFLRTHQIIEEINSCNRIAFEVGGINLKTFRPPFGIINPKVQRALNSTGHQVIGWNLRSYDAILNSKNFILKRIIKNIKPGDVILLHDNNLQTVEILEQLLLFLQTNNYRSVRVDNLFQLNAYS